MDLLQLLILLSITGICGAGAVLTLGFSPRGVMVLLFALIAGTIGAALGVWVMGVLGIPDFFSTIKIGTIRFNIFMTFLGSLAVVGLLMLLQVLLVRVDSRSTKQAESAES